MGCVCIGVRQRGLCGAGVAVGRDAAEPAILFDMDLLRVAAERAAAKIYQHDICDALCVRDRSVFCGECVRVWISM